MSKMFILIVAFCSLASAARAELVKFKSYENHSFVLVSISNSGDYFYGSRTSFEDMTEIEKNTLDNLRNKNQSEALIHCGDYETLQRDRDRESSSCVVKDVYKASIRVECKLTSLFTCK